MHGRLEYLVPDDGYRIGWEDGGELLGGRLALVGDLSRERHLEFMIPGESEFLVELDHRCLTPGS